MEPRRGSIRPRSDLVVAKARHQPDPLRQLQRQGLVAAPDPAFAEAALGRDPLVVLEQRLDLAVVHEGCPEHQLAQETLVGGGCDDDFGQRGLHEPSEIAEALQRSEEHTSELQSLMRISYAVFCLKKKKKKTIK